MRIRTLALAVVLAIPLIGSASRGSAAKIEKDVPLELDRWIELESKDGPVTIHRIRIEKQKGDVTKASFIRPGNTQFLDTVRILVEYSNRDKNKDWEADLDITWLDGSGEEIDGYRDDENVNNDESHEEISVTLATLRYGLRRGKTLRIRIDYHPE